MLQLTHVCYLIGIFILIYFIFIQQKEIVINANLNGSNESVSPNIKETTKSVVINANVNESIPPSVKETIKTVVINDNINESITTSIKEITKQVVINTNLNESIPSTTKKVAINVCVNESNHSIPSSSMQETKKVVYLLNMLKIE